MHSIYRCLLARLLFPRSWSSNGNGEHCRGAMTCEKQVGCGTIKIDVTNRESVLNLSLAQDAMKIRERSGSLVTDIMQGKYNHQIAPNASLHRPDPIRLTPKFRCPHCNYKFDFNIEIGYHTDSQNETLIKHFGREDAIYDLAAAPDGVTFKIIEQWFQDVANPQPLATLHDTIKRMVELKVIKAEETKRIDAYNHNRKTIVYHAIPLRSKRRT